MDDIICRTCGGFGDIQEIRDPEDGSYEWVRCYACQHGLENLFKKPVKHKTEDKAIQRSIDILNKLFGLHKDG